MERLLTHCDEYATYREKNESCVFECLGVYPRTTFPPRRSVAGDGHESKSAAYQADEGGYANGPAEANLIEWLLQYYGINHTAFQQSRLDRLMLRIKGICRTYA
jgi:hypothetical protein